MLVHGGRGRGQGGDRAAVGADGCAAASTERPAPHAHAVDRGARRRGLVPEMPDAGEHDRHPSRFRRSQHVLIAFRATGVDTAVQPASAADLERVGEREERVGRAGRRPRHRSPALRVAIHDESTRDICPAPMPTVAPSLTNTIVFDFTRQAIVHASSRSRHSWAVGSRLEATFQSPRDSRTTSTSWISAPPAACARPARRWAERRPYHPEVRPGCERLQRAVGEGGRDHDLGEHLAHRLGRRLVAAPWKATIPPKALTSSHANAPR